jgi:hypothetical protein
VDGAIAPGQASPYLDDVEANSAIPCNMQLTINLDLNEPVTETDQVLYIQSKNDGATIGFCSFKLESGVSNYSKDVLTPMLGGWQLQVCSSPDNIVPVNVCQVEVVFPDPPLPVEPPVIPPPIVQPIEPPVQQEYVVAPISSTVVAHADCVLVCPQCNSKLIAHFP